MNKNLKDNNDFSLKNYYILAITSFFFLIFSFSCTKIYNFDILWHLKTGYLILSNKSFFKEDPYCAYLMHAKWFNFHELFQILIAFVHSILGFNGLSILKCIIIFALYGIILRRKENSITFFIFIFISLLGFSKRVMLRPELLSYIYLVLLLDIIIHDKKNTKLTIFVIFLIHLLMANSHSIFIIGPILIVFKIISEIFNKNKVGLLFWVKTFFVSIFACLLNSQGIEGILFPIKLFTKVAGNGDFYKANVLEFAIHDFYDFNNFFKTIYILLSLIVIFYSILKKQIFNILVLSSFAYLAISAERNFNLLVCASLPIISSSCFLKSTDTIIKSLFIKKLILSVLIFLSFFYGVLFINNKFYRNENSLKRFGLGLSEIAFSDELSKFLNLLPHSSKIFNTMSLGGYIIFFNYPLKVFYDGRLDVYGIDYFKKYLKMVTDIDFFKKNADSLNIDYVVINHSINESRDLMKLYKDPLWQVIFLDSYAVVFARKHIADSMKVVNNFSAELNNLKKKMFYNGKEIDNYDVSLLNECLRIAVSDMKN